MILRSIPHWSTVTERQRARSKAGFACAADPGACSLALPFPSIVGGDRRICEADSAGACAHTTVGDGRAGTRLRLSDSSLHSANESFPGFSIPSSVHEPTGDCTSGQCTTHGKLELQAYTRLPLICVRHVTLILYCFFFRTVPL